MISRTTSRLSGDTAEQRLASLMIVAQDVVTLHVVTLRDSHRNGTVDFRDIAGAHELWNSRLNGNESAACTSVVAVRRVSEVR